MMSTLRIVCSFCVGTLCPPAVIRQFFEDEVGACPPIISLSASDICSCALPISPTIATPNCEAESAHY